MPDDQDLMQLDLSSQEEMQNYFFATANTIIKSSEQEGIEALRQFITKYGQDGFFASYQRTFLSLKLKNNENKKVVCRLLFYVVLEDYKNLALELLTLGVPVDEGTSCAGDKVYDQQSPLMQACQNNNKEMIQLLLHFNANILHVNAANNLNILKKTQDQTILDFILDEAKKRDCDLQLVQLDLVQDAMELYRVIYTGPEQDCIDLITRIHQKIGIDFEKKILTFTAFMENVEVKVNLLFMAAGKNYLRLVDKLIELGFAVDEGSACAENSNYHAISPLIIAISKNHLEMAKLLINNNANLLCRSSTGYSVLSFISSDEMREIVLDAAKQQNCIQELFKFKYKNNRDGSGKSEDIFERLCMQGLVGGAKVFASMNGLNDYTNAHRFLHHARSAYWHYPEKRKEFEEVCQILRTKATKRTPLELKSRTNHLSYEDAYQKLFSTPPIIRAKLNKEETIKKAIAQYFSLLRSPLRCKSYLMFLESEFSRYYSKKCRQSLPTLDKNMYDFKVIDGLYYPIPNANYVKCGSKHHALQEFLVVLLRSHHLAQKCYKWIGFIPNEPASNMIRNGDFFTESRFGVSLFHNKITHMLQSALLICAINSGDISTFYYENENGEVKEITALDITQALIDLKLGKKSLFGEVRDMRYYEEISFTDPYRLASVIMYEGESWAPMLANYMIASFCQGYEQFLAANNKELGADHALGRDQLMEKMDDNDLRFFTIYPFLIKYSIHREIEKERLAENVDQTKDYAIVPKNYEPDPKFVFP